jgi:hypothetical protein
VTDGFGLGGFSIGGFGLSGGKYVWTSKPLASGTWPFAIKPYDVCGNEGPAEVTSVALLIPPRTPAAFADGRRLTYALEAFGQTGFGQDGFGAPVAVLVWLASPL